MINSTGVQKRGRKLDRSPRREDKRIWKHPDIFTSNLKNNNNTFTKYTIGSTTNCNKKKERLFAELNKEHKILKHARVSAHTNTQVLASIYGKLLSCEKIWLGPRKQSNNRHIAQGKNWKNYLWMHRYMSSWIWE